jgi:D-methionine transport system substrate-binding protein
MRIFVAIIVTVLASMVPAQAETIRVGVTGGPHAEILDVVKKVAAERGIDIKVIEKNQISKTGWKIAKVANTFRSPQGVYSVKYKSLAELPEGAKVAIANDPSNGARGLMILALHGAIKLRDPTNVASTVADITDNPKKLHFLELDAAQLPRSLQDVDLVSINNNFAVQAGLDPAKDAIARENPDGPWVNILAVHEEDKDKPWVKQLIDASAPIFRPGNQASLALVAIYSEAKIAPFPFGRAPQTETCVARRK